MIQDGQIVQWSHPDLYACFSRETAFRLYRMLPITGMIRDVNGNMGILSFIGPHGREQLPVLLAECVPVGVNHAS